MGTKNVDAIFYKSLDNTNILLLNYYNAEIGIWKALHYVHSAQTFTAYSIEYCNELQAQFFLYIEREKQIT